MTKRSNHMRRSLLLVATVSVAAMGTTTTAAAERGSSLAQHERWSRRHDQKKIPLHQQPDRHHQERINREKQQQLKDHPNLRAKIKFQNQFQNQSHQQQQQQTHPVNQQRHRSLSASYCGNGWQNAFDTCNRPCTLGKDEMCGPGQYCYGYVACTPPPDPPAEISNSARPGTTNPWEDQIPNSNNNNNNNGGWNYVGGSNANTNNNNNNGGGGNTNPWEDQIPNSNSNNNNNNNNNQAAYMTAAKPVPYPSSPSKPSNNNSNNSNNNNYPTMPSILPPSQYVPSYIASLPIKPSYPTTPAPFILPMPTPNMGSNPNKNFCGYGWESAMNECFHACPSGKDDQCPSGKTCHSWLTCTPSRTDPATFNVCGKNWSHASSTCKTRCFLGSDDTCPPGETCFGGLEDCGEKLPELTAEDVGLVQKSYTEEEVKVLLDEEIARERDEEAMEDSKNWWCGTSWSNMLETCSKKCTSDEECKPDAWTEAHCYKTPGGPDNCSTPGVPVKAPVPPGSRWCGSTWNDMLESCSKKCEQEEDCDWGQQCWEAPDTCQYIGVPVKEKSDPASLWCGVDYGDAGTSCHKACPGETNEECPEGMSCFSGSTCTEEGTPIVREGYRCGTSWSDASKECGLECQNSSECKSNEECHAEVVCEKDILNVDEDGNPTSGMFCGVTWESTARSCAQSCKEDEDCDNGNWCYWVDCENGNKSAFEEPTTGATEASCNAEVKRCPNGQFVGRAQILDCDFYPCPEGSVPEADGGNAQEMAAMQDSGGDPDLSGWGSTPLAHECSSDGEGNCGLCEGDCNSDEDCQDGLMCFSRGQGEMTRVPGCVSGGSGDKPGMDYCYTPFPPMTTTTTTTTTTTSTTTTATTTIEDMSANFMSASYLIGELDYIRECSGTRPCGACEGDCDNDIQCAGGLLCYSRGVGSVDLVPGCLGLGVAGMDYCHDSSAPIVTPPTPSPTRGGCSAEIRACPSGLILYRDPNNNCQFPLCPSPSTPEPTTKPPTASPQSSRPTIDMSSFYCGYNLNQVNGKCNTAKPCPRGTDRECSGMEVCIRGTNCGSNGAITTTTSTAQAATAAAVTARPSTHLEQCDALCVDSLPSEWCPETTSERDLPNCLDVFVGELCESDGECATDDALNNCGTYDIYARVVCGSSKVSQGQIMRMTESPTPGPSGSPTLIPTEAPTTANPTTKPTKSPTTKPIATPAPTISPVQMEMGLSEAFVAAANIDDTASTSEASVSISIADAIADATANAEASGSLNQAAASQGPTSPPVREYESNAFTYDRVPGGGGEDSSSTLTENGANNDDPWTEAGAGSSDWYNTPYEYEEPLTGADADVGAEEAAPWGSFDSYFRGPASRSFGRTMMSGGAVSIITGTVALLACLS